MQRKPLNTYKNRQRWPGTAYWIILFVTIVLLISLTATFFVALAVTDRPDAPDGPDANGDSSSNTEVVTKKGKKTGIVLPSATQSGNYLSVNADNVKTISEISSEAAILVNADSMLTVAGKNSDTEVHPASMTKVMTLLVACENLKDPNAFLTVTQDVLDRKLSSQGGSGPLVENTLIQDGETRVNMLGKAITVESALYLISGQSDTVSCFMIAKHIAGSEEEFVKLMNQKAKDLGLTKTRFVNTTGLTEKDGGFNKTTCREMATIMACALKNKTVKDILSYTDKYEADIYDNGRKTQNYIPFYPYWLYGDDRLDGNAQAGKVTILGGKTGYEDIPSSCIVTYGTSTSGKTFICVTVGMAIPSSSSPVGNIQGTADMRYIYKNYAG